MEMDETESVAEYSHACPIPHLPVPDWLHETAMANVSAAPADGSAPVAVEWDMLTDAQRGVTPTPPVSFTPQNPLQSIAGSPPDPQRNICTDASHACDVCQEGLGFGKEAERHAGDFAGGGTDVWQRAALHVGRLHVHALHVVRLDADSSSDALR